MAKPYIHLDAGTAYAEQGVPVAVRWEGIQEARIFCFVFLSTEKNEGMILHFHPIQKLPRRSVFDSRYSLIYELGLPNMRKTDFALHLDMRD